MATLSGLLVSIFGRSALLYNWPVAILGSNAAGNPVPLKLADDGTITATVTASTATTVSSTALEASHVLKASAGKLASLGVLNTGPDQFILIMNSATVQANGAVTLLYPPIKVLAGENVSLTFPIPLSASAGVSVCNSSTGSFTKTLGSADCIFTGQVI